MIYRFHECVIDTASRTVSRNGQSIHVERQVFEVICCLIERRHRLVSKDELIACVWNGRAISDGAVAARISAARRVLGDDGRRQSLIQTLTGVGFRFVGQLQDAPQAEALRDFDQEDARPSLCVLPLQSLDPEACSNAVGAGLSDELIGLLGRTHWLKVVAPGSSRLIGPTPPSAGGIAAALDVTYVAVGHVFREGTRVQATVKLLDAGTHEHLAVFKERCDYPEVLYAIDELAIRLAGALLPEIRSRELKRLRRSQSPSIQAWETQLRASDLLKQCTKDACATADTLLSRVLDHEPDYAAALAGRAQCAIQIGYSGWKQEWHENPHEVADIAMTYARTAIAAEPSEALGYDALASAHHYIRELEATARPARQTIELSPTCAPAYGTLATSLAFLGQPDAALAAYRAIQRISPRDPEISSALMGALVAEFVAGRYENAIEYARQHMLLKPNWFGSYIYKASAQALMGDLIGAEQTIKQLRRMRPSLTLSIIRRHRMLKKKENYERCLRGLSLAGMPEG